MEAQILFISRGYGFGHSTRDIIIAKRLYSLDERINIIMASYDSGYEILKMNGYEPIDLELPKIGSNADRIEKIGNLIKSTKPNLVVSDEEIMALPLASVFGIKSVFITNWFPKDENTLNFFKKANYIIFPDLADLIDTPQMLLEKVIFVGPIVQLNIKQDKYKIRSELGIADPTKLIIVTAGSVDQIDIPFFQASIQAFKMLKIPSKLILMAGPYAKAFATPKNENIVVMSYLKDIHDYIGAADLVITRGGHTTLWELAILGIPSIAIPRPFAFNPANEIYAENMEKRGTTVFIPSNQLTSSLIFERMNSILGNQSQWQQMSENGLKYRSMSGGEKSAQYIMQLMSFSN